MFSWALYFFGLDGMLFRLIIRYGFNGGAALGANARAAMSAFVTTVCASFAGLTFVLIDSFKTKKVSLLSFCTGAVVGLVVITPAAGIIILT
jgi:Amt family ammonium transporter